MKKAVYTLFVLALAAALTLSLVACGANDPLSQAERAFAAVVETADSLDNPDEADLSESNVQLSATSDEVTGTVRLSSNDTESEMLLLAGNGNGNGNSENILQIKEYLATIRARQQELQGYKTDVKVEIATFRANVEAFKAEGLSLTEEEKELLGDYVDEIKSLNTSIKGTIGKVYSSLHKAKGKYTLESLNEAIAELQGIVDEMDIRVDSAKRLYEIALELNTSLSQKLNPAE